MVSELGSEQRSSQVSAIAQLTLAKHREVSYDKHGKTPFQKQPLS